MNPSLTEAPTASDAVRLAEAAEFGPREHTGAARIIVPGIAVAWSLFQLALPYALTLNSDIVRTVHLVFAITLVYLSYPALRKHKTTGWAAFLSQTRGIPVFDIVLAVLGAGAAAYYALEYDGLAMRPGMPLARDIVAGILLLVLLLEASRRSLGPTLTCVAGAFIALAFLGPNLPGALAFKRVSLRQLLGQLTMSTEGIYGIPLYVSSTMVFLFVLLGAMLEKSGGGRYFVQLALSLVGRFRGGPAKAAVLASGLTGMVSGSSIANTVTTGTFTIPLMKRCGYPAEKAAAVEVAASTNGQLMPPVMGAAAFIIAESCGISYLDVVKAAFVPAFVSYLTLIFITHLEACKLGLHGLPPEEVPRFREVFVGGIHFLIPPGLLVILLCLRFSPEFAAFWAIAALAVLMVVRDQVLARQRGEKPGAAFKGTLALLRDSLQAGGRNMMSIGVAVATAGIIVGVMTLGPGSLVTQVVTGLAGGNLVLMLILSAFIALVLGMGLPTTANYVVVSTLVAGTLQTIAGNAGLVLPVISAHLFCFFFGILADDTPPVGLAAYAAAAIAGSDPIRTGIQGFMYDIRTAILPFMFFFNKELLLIGVHSPLAAAFVFCKALIAMCAFAALTQNYLLTVNRAHESLLLGAGALLLLRPGFFAVYLPGGVHGVHAAAVAVLLPVIGLQLLRTRRAAAKAL